jgi:hypothetical protein
MSFNLDLDIDMDVHWQNRRQRIIRFMGLFMSIFVTITTSLLDFIVVKQPHHTSILTGEAWVAELLAGHPLRILSQLGVWHHVFEALITTMHDLGLDNSRHVSLEEQLTIFLYASTTGCQQEIYLCRYTLCQ